MWIGRKYGTFAAVFFGGLLPSWWVTSLLENLVTHLTPDCLFFLCDYFTSGYGVTPFYLSVVPRPNFQTLHTHTLAAESTLLYVEFIGDGRWKCPEEGHSRGWFYWTVIKIRLSRTMEFSKNEKFISNQVCCYTFLLPGNAIITSNIDTNARYKSSNTEAYEMA